MRRALAVAALLAVTGAGAGCATAVQHPVPTLGLVGGLIGFGTCEMDQVEIGTCGIIAASTAVFMGGVAGIVYLLTEQPTPQMEGEVVEPPMHRRPRMLPPEPESGSASGSSPGPEPGPSPGPEPGPSPVPGAGSGT